MRWGLRRGVIVLDAYAVIAALLDEPAEQRWPPLLRSDEPAVLTPLGVAEVLDRLLRRTGIDPDELILDLAELGLADPEPLQPEVAVRVGLLRSRYQHRTRCAVALAVCVVVEAARGHDATVATSDPHLLDVCHAEGVAAMALPRGGYDSVVTFTRITTDPDRMGGAPCIRDLRFPVATVVAMVADGMTTDEILAEHPDLEADDIAEALRYAALAVNERALPLRLPA